MAGSGLVDGTWGGRNWGSRPGCQGLVVPELGEGTGQVQGWLMRAEEDPGLILGVR